MEKKTDELIMKLANTFTDEGLFNPYNQICKLFDISTAPGLRQGNLRIYLDSYLTKKVDVLWVFDTADYYGTKLSGIPIVEPPNYENVENIFDLSLHFESASKYGLVSQSSNLYTKVWNHISKLRKRPLIWNVFPFYAHDADDISVRRDPTNEEYIKYSDFIRTIISIYKPDKVLAVGVKAKKALDLLNIKSKHFQID